MISFKKWQGNYLTASWKVLGGAFMKGKMMLSMVRSFSLVAARITGVLTPFDALLLWGSLVGVAPFFS